MKLQWTDRGSVDHEMIWGSIALLLIVAAVVVPVPRIGLRCPFRALTGVPCPTCGGTHALVAMSHLRFAEGFARNPLVAAGWVGAALFVPYAAAVCLLRSRRFRVADVTDRERRSIALLVLGLLLANWAYVIVRG
jgi:hypothetical protein